VKYEQKSGDEADVARILLSSFSFFPEYWDNFHPRWEAS
jgi:hypothetical protein